MGFFLRLADEPVTAHSPLALVGIGPTGSAISHHLLSHQLPLHAHHFIKNTSEIASISNTAILILVHAPHPSQQDRRLLLSAARHARTIGALLISIAVPITPVSCTAPSPDSRYLRALQPDAHLALPSHEELTTLLSSVASAPRASLLLLQRSAQLIAALLDALLAQGRVNVGADDLRTMFQQSARAHLGVATTSGPNRAHRAAAQALANINSHSLSAVMLSVRAGTSLKLRELDEAASLVRESVRDNVEIHWSTTIDDTLTDAMHLVLIGAQLPRGAHAQRRRPPAASHAMRGAPIDSVARRYSARRASP